MERERTYNVDGDDARVKVDSQATHTDVGAQTLRQRSVTKLSGSKKCRNSLRNQHPTGRVKVRRDVVAEDLLQYLLGRLVMVLWDLLECTVGGRKDGDVTGFG